MSTEHFRITYDGPALDTHEMDVRDLAPALLSLADACDAASQALFGPKSKMVVNVKASFKTGSFGVDLTLTSGVLQSTIDWFAGKDGQGLANATAVLLGLGAFSIANLAFQEGNKWRRACNACARTTFWFAPLAASTFLVQLCRVTGAG